MSSRGSSSKVKSSSPNTSLTKATKTTPIKKIDPYLKPISPFKKKALFVDKGKSQEKQSNLYSVCIQNSPIILFITENGTPCYPASRYDGIGTQKKAWSAKLELGEHHCCFYYWFLTSY